MDFSDKLAKAVDYIEEHITDDIDFNHVARIICCEAYQFGRIFSYVVGTPLSEYIRNRRLSLAALELQTGLIKVVDVALKYGYDSPESFFRAFRKMHGITPKEAFSTGVKLKFYPRLNFKISIKGNVEMEYRFEKRDAINGVGVVKNLGRWTSNQDCNNWQERGGAAWDTWDRFLNGGMNSIIRDKYKLYKAPLWQCGVMHTLPNGEIELFIGAEDAGGFYPELERYEIPANLWVVFKAYGSLNQSIHPLEEAITKIFTEWLPSSGYAKSMSYQIEVYGPGDTQLDEYISEIWIPIQKI